jgi:hypothetical protein
MVAALVRLHGIGGPEPFVDEGANILTSLNVRVREAFEPLAQGRPWLVYLFKPAGWFPAQALEVARFMSAGAGLATLAALGWTLWHLAGRGAALAGLWLWALLPIAVFHERLALQDPFVTALIAWCVALLANSSLGRETARGGLWFFGAGLLFGAAFLLKISAGFTLPWIGLLWWEFRRRTGRPIFERRLGWAALGALLPLATLGTDLAKLGSKLDRYHALTTQSDAATDASLADRLGQWLELYFGYGGWPLLVLAALAVGATVRFRSRVAAMCAGGWLLALLVSGCFYNNTYGRYLLPDHLPLILFLAVAGATLPSRAGRFRAATPALFALPLAGWAVADWQIGRDPAKAAIAASEAAQYFTSPWSGRGVREVRDYLTARADRDKAQCLVITHRFLRPGCYGLLLAELGDPRIGVVPITIYEPQELAAALPGLRHAAAGHRVRCFLLYEGSIYPAHPWLNAPGSPTRRVLEVPRGPGESFTLFEFELAASVPQAPGRASP